MNKDHVVNLLTPVSLFAPASYTADANGTGIDLMPYDGPCAVLLNCNAGSSTSLTTNGTFAADSDWTKGDAAVTISGGVANWSGAQTGNADLSQNQACTAATRYTVTYTITRSAGSITPMLGGTAGTTRSAAGTYTEVITCGSGSDPKLVFRGGVGFTGTLDNVSVIAASMAVHLEESSDDVSYTDITGAVFSTVYGIASLQKLIIQADERKRYLRAVLDITGDSAAFVLSVTALPIPSNR